MGNGGGTARGVRRPGPRTDCHQPRPHEPCDLGQTATPVGLPPHLRNEQVGKWDLQNPLMIPLSNGGL